MRNLVLAIVVCILLWNVAVADAAVPVERHWKVDGVDRVALVYAPPVASTAPTPVIFAFHGHGGTMHYAARNFDYHHLWPEAISVYMQGLPTPGALTDPQGTRNGWQKMAGDQNDRDLKFFDAVLASLKTQYKIDAKRIFATGHSNGGSFTYVLWAERGDTFAAVAPAAAIAGRSTPHLRPKPVMCIAGENDELVRFPWQQQMMNTIGQLNNCSTAGTLWAKSGTFTATYYPSKNGTPLITAIYQGGHRYPPESSPLIVKFFKEQSAIRAR